MAVTKASLIAAASFLRLRARVTALGLYTQRAVTSFVAEIGLDAAESEEIESGIEASARRLADYLTR
jgi:hypothetical protein